MFASGTHSAIGTSQKRLTIVVAVLGLLGSLLLGLVWCDSLENSTSYSTQNRSIYTSCSAVNYRDESMMWKGFDEPFGRLKYDDSDFVRPLFPPPQISYGYISIPIYLLILAYLATLLLIWLVLMNRLARRDFTKTLRIQTED